MQQQPAAREGCPNARPAQPSTWPHGVLEMRIYLSGHVGGTCGAARSGQLCAHPAALGASTAAGLAAPLPAVATADEARRSGEGARCSYVPLGAGSQAASKRISYGCTASGSPV